MEKQSDARRSAGHSPEFPRLPSSHPKLDRGQSADFRVSPISWKEPSPREPTAVADGLSLPPRPDTVNVSFAAGREGKPAAGIDGPKMAHSRRSRRRSPGPEEGRRPSPGVDSKVFSWLAGLVLCGGLCFFLGLAAGLYRTRPMDARALPERQGFETADAQQEKLLNRAFALMREGDGEAALRALKELRTINPHLASLSYTAALAAAQSGDIAVAMRETGDSIGKGERVSDSYALAAAVESLKPGSVEWQSMGDPRERGDFFLRQAIAADQANAAPRLELGMRMRSRGRNEEAAEMLESARLRLHPVDQAAVIDTTLLLIALEQTENVALPVDLDADKNTASLMGAAHVALRRGDITAGAALLGTAKSRLAPDLYYYLLGDPTFAPYRNIPELAPFFR